MTESVHIESFTDDALGLVKNIHVPFVLPGEEVTLTKPFKKKGKKFAEAELIQSYSPKRVTPFCPHFGTCGGCLIQHLDYEEEALWKEERIKKLFECFEVEKFYPILKAPKMQGWRNKMEFTFSPNGAAGLHRFFGKRSVFETTNCSLGPPWFQEALTAFQAFQKEQGLSGFNSYSNEGSLRTLTVRNGFKSNQRMVVMTVSGNHQFAWNKGQIEAYKEKAKTLGITSLYLVIHQAVRGQPTQLFEMHLQGSDVIEEGMKIGDKELVFQISPKAFFQPNPEQAEKLYAKAFELLDLQGDEVLYDLFAGTATLGLFGALFAKEVFSIELSPEACLDAESNKVKNNIQNIKIIQGDVYEILNKNSLPKPDVLMIDPPRVGLTPKALETIIGLNAQKIAYISCNPNTQKENLYPLLEAGWRIRAIQPVDQFPRSPHVENIALLEKK